jgi:hypothetical protein
LITRFLNNKKYCEPNEKKEIIIFAENNEEITLNCRVSKNVCERTLNNCSNNGKCNEIGYCDCNKGFANYDCSSKLIYINNMPLMGEYYFKQQDWVFFNFVLENEQLLSIKIKLIEKKITYHESHKIGIDLK